MHKYKIGDGRLTEKDVSVCKHMVISSLGNISMQRSFSVDVVYKDDTITAVSEQYTSLPLIVENLYGANDLHKIVRAILAATDVVDDKDMLEKLRVAHATIVSNGTVEEDDPAIKFNDDTCVYQIESGDHTLVAFSRDNVSYIAMYHTVSEAFSFGAAFTSNRALIHGFVQMEYEKFLKACLRLNNTKIVIDGTWFMSQLRKRTKDDAQLLDEIVRIANLCIYNNRFTVEDLCEVARNDLGL